MDDDDIMILEDPGPSRPKVPVDPKPTSSIPSGSKRSAVPELDDSKSTPAKRRWALLSSYLTKRNRKISKEVDSLGLYQLQEMERDEYGKWSKLKWVEREADWPSPEIRMLEFEKLDPTDLTGFNNTGNIRIWLSEECLAYYLLKTVEDLKGKSVLELGGGMTGLAGICCAYYADHVVITDGNERSMENVSSIIAKNQLTNCETMCFRWEEAKSLSLQKFDLIVAADCFFQTEGHRSFINVLEQCLKEDGTVVICAPERAGTLRSFLETLFERGTFVVDQTANVCDEIVKKISMLTAKDPEFDADKYHVKRLLSDEALARICFSISEEVKEEKEIDPAAVLRIAGIVKGLLLNKWMPQLEAVSRVAKRQTINEDDVKAIFAHNHQLVGTISPVKTRKKEPKRKTLTPKSKKSNTLDKTYSSKTITQYIRESSTVGVDDDEPEGPTDFHALKEAVKQEEEERERKGNEENESKKPIQDSWSDDSWDEAPSRQVPEKPTSTLASHPDTSKQGANQETQFSSATAVLRELKPLGSPHNNPSRVRFEPQVTSTPREILKQKEVPKITQSTKAVSEAPFSDGSASEIPRNLQQSSNVVSETTPSIISTPKQKKQPRPALRGNERPQKCPQKSSNAVPENPCSPVSSKKVDDDWEDDSLFEDPPTPKSNLNTSITKATDRTPELTNSPMDYMKDSATLLDDEKKKLLKSGKPLPPELLPIPASVLLKRMKDDELRQTPMKRKGFNFDSDDENFSDKRPKITTEDVEDAPATTAAPVPQKISPGLAKKPSLPGRFSFDDE